MPRARPPCSQPLSGASLFVSKTVEGMSRDVKGLTPHGQASTDLHNQQMRVRQPRELSAATPLLRPYPRPPRIVPVVGTEVKHPKRGFGTVSKVLTDGRAVVQFDNGEVHRYQLHSLHKLARWTQPAFMPRKVSTRAQPPPQQTFTPIVPTTARIATEASQSHEARESNPELRRRQSMSEDADWIPLGVTRQWS